MSQQFSKENPPILPDGGRWQAVYDEQYQQYYYVDLQNNNQSQWNPPEGTRTMDALQQSNNPSDKGLFSSLTNTVSQQQQNGQQQQYYQQQNGQQQYYQPQQQASTKTSSFPTNTVMGVAGGALGAMLLKNVFSHNGGSGHNRPNSGPPGGFFGGGNGGGFGGGNGGGFGGGRHNGGGGGDGGRHGGRGGGGGPGGW